MGAWMSNQEETHQHGKAANDLDIGFRYMVAYYGLGNEQATQNQLPNIIIDDHHPPLTSRRLQITFHSFIHSFIHVDDTIVIHHFPFFIHGLVQRKSKVV
jgi:hypothetical protein